MKKLIIGIISTVLVTIVAYLLFPIIMMNNIKDKVIEINSNIANIVTINHINSWGEWFSEYVLVIEMDGQRYRIWTNNKGEITDQEALD